MSWVTMTMVYSCFNSLMRSSIAIVEIGSSDEHGLVHQQHIGLHGDGPPMHSRWCWPPDSPPPGLSNRSLTLFDRLAPAAMLRRFVEHPAIAHPLQPQSGDDVVTNRLAGNGFGRWNTIPMARRTPPDRCRRHRCPRRRAAPWPRPRAPGITSCIGSACAAPSSAAARRPDERGHAARQHRKRDIGDGLERAVLHVDAVKDSEPLGHLVLLLRLPAMTERRGVHARP